MEKDKEIDVWVYYNGGIDSNADKKIRTLFESIGLKWYGSGTQLDSQRRDNSFHGKITVKE